MTAAKHSRRERRTGHEIERGHRQPQYGNSRSWRPARWLLQPDRDDWLPQRACKGTDPDVFCPPTRRTSPDNPSRKLAVAPALAICSVCPVRPQCALEAIRLGISHGVVGGVDLGDASRKSEQTRADRVALARAAGIDPAELAHAIPK